MDTPVILARAAVAPAQAHRGRRRGRLLLQEPPRRRGRVARLQHGADRAPRGRDGQERRRAPRQAARPGLEPAAVPRGDAHARRRARARAPRRRGAGRRPQPVDRPHPRDRDARRDAARPAVAQAPARQGLLAAAIASTCPSASRSARCEDTTALIERVQSFFDSANGDGGPSPSPYRRKKLVGSPPDRLVSAAGGRPRPTSGSPPQPGSSWRQREVHLSDGARMVVDRACLAGRWGITGDGAGDEHDQAGRLQAPRPRAHGQDGRVLHRGAGAAARARPAPATLHVTNGDSTAHSLLQTTLVERVVVWRDVLHEGPVPDGRRRGAARRARAVPRRDRVGATSRSATPRSPPGATASTCCGSRPTSTTSCRSRRSWPGSRRCACPPSASRSSASASTSASRTSAAWASCAPISSRACPRPRR